MRWERLFLDLEDQLDYEMDAELEDMARDAERLRISRLGFADRFRTLARRSPSPALVSIAVGDIGYDVSLIRVGRDWILADVIAPQRCRGAALFPVQSVTRAEFNVKNHVMASLEAVEMVEPGVSSKPSLIKEINLTFVLRDLCRRRKHVSVQCRGTELSGTIERVGRDHFDLAVHPQDTYRNDARGEGVSIIALAHVELIRLL